MTDPRPAQPPEPLTAEEREELRSMAQAAVSASSPFDRVVKANAVAMMCPPDVLLRLLAQLQALTEQVERLTEENEALREYVDPDDVACVVEALQDVIKDADDEAALAERREEPRP